MKGLVLEHLTRNNQRRIDRKISRRGQWKKKTKKRAIAHQESLPLLAVAD